jgi:hypothetical protein
MLVAIPFLAIVLGLFAGFVTVRSGLTGLAWGLATALGAALAVTLFKENAAQGLDVLFWTGLWVFVLLPAMLALGLGAVLGRMDAAPRGAVV